MAGSKLTFEYRGRVVVIYFFTQWRDLEMSEGVRVALFRFLDRIGTEDATDVQGYMVQKE